MWVYSVVLDLPRASVARAGGKPRTLRLPRHHPSPSPGAPLRTCLSRLPSRAAPTTVGPAGSPFLAPPPQGAGRGPTPCPPAHTQQLRRGLPAPAPGTNRPRPPPRHPPNPRQHAQSSCSLAAGRAANKARTPGCPQQW